MNIRISTLFFAHFYYYYYYVYLHITVPLYYVLYIFYCISSVAFHHNITITQNAF